MGCGHDPETTCERSGMSAGAMEEMNGLLWFGVSENRAQRKNVESQDEKVASFLVRRIDCEKKMCI
jgi:hypothetical protein